MRKLQMVAWSDAELDEMTDEFLALMLGERNFIKRWTADVEKELAREQMEKKSFASSPAMRGADHGDQALAIAVFEELIHAIDASSQTFLSAVDFTICHCEPEHNRDASLLFAARLQVDRITSRMVGRARYETAARRLLQLVRLFTTRISSAFQISNTSAFATSLCDMLYTFCDGCARLKIEQNTLSDLHRAVDDFNEIVVEKLSKVAFEAQCVRRRTTTSSRQQCYSPQPVKLRRPLVQIQQRSPGYLLPAELYKKRQRLARSRSQPALAPSSGNRPQRVLTKDRLEVSGDTKRSRLHQPSAAVDPIPATTSEEANEATIRLARKISSEVMRDLRKKYGNVDLGLLGI
ncbi:unnamed protein product [Cylicocyclus nassatus]|uniref:Uncharacterized protein n=1 Tax=Cylicocyclus nassatus TaxID=53992 RepID=A0AA36M6C4_CYLNA|nr:unnamed protein product [Cylicocyclus nassatus]